MKNRALFNRGVSLLGLSCLLVLSLVSAPVQAKACAPHVNGGTIVSATIWGTFTDYAWRGNAMVRIGDAEPMLASFVDISAGPPQVGDDGVLSGGETITFDFGGGNTFQVVATFKAYPGATPMIYTLDELGTVDNPTGEFAGMSGAVSIRGPFVFPLLVLGEDDAPPGWVAQMKGKVRFSAQK